MILNMDQNARFLDNGSGIDLVCISQNRLCATYTWRSVSYPGSAVRSADPKATRRLSRVPGRTQLKVRAADAGRPRAAQGHERGSSQVQAGAGGPAWPWGARDGVQGHASAGPSGPNARPILLPAISLGRGFEGAQSNRQQPILDEVTLKQKLPLQEPTPEEICRITNRQLMCRVV